MIRGRSLRLAIKSSAVAAMAATLTSVPPPSGGLQEYCLAVTLQVYLNPSSGSFKTGDIISAVFSSYKDNKWENIKVVTQTQLDAYPTVQAIKLQGGDGKVYLLDFSNKQKRWIKTPAALVRLGIALDKVVSVNQTEFNAYTDGAPIE